MSLGAALLLVGAAQIYAAADRGGWWTLLAWPGAAFCAVGAAHLASLPGLLGKRADGRIAWLPFAAFLPYFLVIRARWRLQCLISRERPWDEIAPGLFLGRWPDRCGLPSGVGLVVDMTAELPAAARGTPGCAYVYIPTVDTGAPDEALFTSVVHRVAESGDPVYVHCALGHGRSATFVAAVLLERGLARTVPEALERLRAARPRVRCGPRQLRFLETFAARRPTPSQETSTADPTRRA